MAFISEINFRGTGAGEYVEITLGPGDDPANFVVSAYRETGALHTTAGIATGQVNLSTLTGTPHPDNPAYTIYTISVGIRNANSDTDEASGIALTDTSAGGGVIGFYSADANSPITATAGQASGATSANVLDHKAIAAGESYQWDIHGNTVLGATSSGSSVICITADTQVTTDIGEVSARDLKIGDLVWTLDRGFQPIRWIGSKYLSAFDLIKAPKNRPIRICQNALGHKTPVRDLLVSPQHRILARSKVAERMFGSAEVLVAAVKLCGLEGVTQTAPATGICYMHLLFERHEIICADGALVESLLIAEQSEAIIDTATIAGCNDLARIPTRPVISGKKSAILVKRIQKNGRPIVEGATFGARAVHALCT